MAITNIKKPSVIVIALLIFGAVAAQAQSTAKKLCVNGSSSVFARVKCLVAEKEFVIPVATPSPVPTSTPLPTPTSTPGPTPTSTPTNLSGLLNLTTCRRVSTSVASTIGVATAGFQCDVNSEFVLEYGFNTSDGFRSDASVRQQQILYTQNGNLPIGVNVTMGGTRSSNFTLNLTATCCQK